LQISPQILILSQTTPQKTIKNITETTTITTTPPRLIPPLLLEGGEWGTESIVYQRQLYVPIHKELSIVGLKYPLFVPYFVKVKDAEPCVVLESVCQTTTRYSSAVK
jgi:hypothetical protein